MSVGRKARPTLLKLISGSAQPCRMRDDKPKHADPPTLPPGVELTPAERAMFAWLLEHVAVPGVHGTGDGAAFVNCARTWAQANEVDALIRARGGVSGRDETLKLLRLSATLRKEVRTTLAEIGGTPSGRQKTAGPKSKGAGEDAASSWRKFST